MTTLNTEAVTAGSNEHRTVSRVMTILEMVVASEPTGLRLADLSDMLGAPKSSIHGLARGLVATGHLREHAGRYFQGPAVSMLALGGQAITAAYRHTLEQLAAEWNETAILATSAGDSVINIDVVEPNQTIRASPPLHERRPMWPGSYGKVFVAYMSPRRRDAYLRRKYPDPQQQKAILDEVALIRASGVAINRGETDPELYGVASPIIIGGPEVTLAIGLAGPSARMIDRIDVIAERVATVARGLSNTSLKDS
ncbi:IclR family transcriptional regulator [Rhodococcus sp. NPDC056743]|uniref:IclR family transcriptional regulator n=1 Tax=Rhodococcus sp. NPDC056743 TaxID=3345934 RepID=UPI003671E664